MRHILFFALLFISRIVNAQTPNFVWAKGFGGLDNENVSSVATDINGNVFMAGNFLSDTLNFDSLSLSNTNQNTSSFTYLKSDIFIAKFDNEGNTLWAKNAIGNKYDNSLAMSLDYDGNVIVTGSFNSDTLYFDSISLIHSVPNPNSNAVGDFFIVKFDTFGNVLWAKSAYKAAGNSIAVDLNNNVFVSGSYYATNFLVLDSITINNQGLNDIFLAKYNESGNLIWGKSIGGASSDWDKAVTTDMSGNVFLTGYTQSSTISIDTTSLTMTCRTFIAKFKPNGDLIWAINAADSGLIDGESIATDMNGNLILVGGFHSASVNFSSITLTNYVTNPSIANDYGSDVLIVKYDSYGNVLWAKSAGAINHDIAKSVFIDGSDHIYVTGDFSYQLIFGPFSLTEISWENLFILKLDASGNSLWLKSALKANASAICVDNDNNAFIIGSYDHNANFDSITLIANPSYYTNIFLTKLDITTGVEEINNTIEQVIYPNPFTSTATFQSKSTLKNATAIIYNTLGQEVKQIKNISGSSFNIERDNIPTGLYFINLAEGNKLITTEKLVITD
jgi:acyl CoA:acetate/3-ketoacid CoA transferase alpha subunit